MIEEALQLRSEQQGSITVFLQHMWADLLQTFFQGQGWWIVNYTPPWSQTVLKHAMEQTIVL